jgi:hypothetical protein
VLVKVMFNNEMTLVAERIVMFASVAKIVWIKPVFKIMKKIKRTHILFVQS